MTESWTWVKGFLRLALILFPIGTVFLMLKLWLEQPAIIIITDAIGIAFYTTLVIGAFIESPLREKLSKDVFQATIGYLLPKELREHMRWIYEQSFICTADTITLELTEVSDYVRLFVTRTQTLENKGNKAITDIPALSIDEWHIPGHASRIIDFKCKADKGSWPDGPIPGSEKGPHNLRVVSKEFRIAPRARLYIRSVFEEWKLKNDDFLYHYKYPTTETHVTVKVPETLGYELRFATIGSEPVQINDAWVLPTATLPGQYVRIWWWRKADSEKWMRETNKEET